MAARIVGHVEGERMGCRFTELIVDCQDMGRMADFWSAVLGWERTASDEGAVEIAAPGGGRPTLVFVPVPEQKTLKNRLHIDVSPSGGSDQQREVERLIGLGARPADVGQGEQTWVVLADPEGNEFCVLRTPVE
jgi:predicted enzyme related to lactoylglutathione lyase